MLALRRALTGVAGTAIACSAGTISAPVGLVVEPASDAGVVLATEADPVPSAVDAGRDAATAGWSPRASLPRPMDSVSVVALGGKLYALGGFDETGSVLADVAVYDPKQDAWSAGVPLPRPLHHVNATVAGDRIWITGALEGTTFAATGITLVLDPAAGTWIERSSMPPATERGSAMTAAIGETIYVAGGLRGAAVADFFAYDTELDTWSLLPSLPTARDHGSAVAAGGLFYAVSGRSTAVGAPTALLDVFDPARDTWTALPPMPTSRAGSGVALVEGRIIVAGGIAGPPLASPAAEVYDIATYTWSPLPAMITPRQGMGAAAIDGVVYVPGGGIRENTAVATVEALRL